MGQPWWSGGWHSFLVLPPAWRLTLRYPVSPKYAFHPLMPMKLGYLQLLRLVNPRLAALLDVTDPFTLMSARKRTTLYREGLRVLRAGVPGAFVEIGVHRGGSAAVLAHVIKDEHGRALHLFDRWGDLPEPTEQDGYRGEQYAKDAIRDKLVELEVDSPLEAAREVVEEIVGLPADRVHYHQGWYDSTLAQYDGGPIAFASIDCDYYESVKLALWVVERHASVGTVMVLDDYATWPGTRTALEQWLSKTRLRTRVLALSIGPAIVRVTGTD